MSHELIVCIVRLYSVCYSAYYFVASKSYYYYIVGESIKQHEQIAYFHISSPKH